MRVADRTSARNYLKYLNKAKSDFAKTDARIASGNRFEELSDDVSSGTRVLRTRTELFKAEKHYDNVKTINDELGTTESAMMSINDILGKVHSEKVVKALSTSTGESGRQSIANEIKAMKDEILQFANTKYSKKFVFGGSNSSYNAPFTFNKDGALQFNGINMDDIKQRTDGSYYYKDAAGIETEIPMSKDVYTDVGLGIKMSGSNVDPDTGFCVSYSGMEILGFGIDKNGVSNNIVNILTDLEKSIRNFDQKEIEKFDTKLIEASDLFRSNLTSIGAKTNFLDTMQNRLKTSVDGHKIRINDLMGTNDAEEATNQTMNEFVLKAVVQMGARLVPVSLMDFLR